MGISKTLLTQIQQKNPELITLHLSSQYPSLNDDDIANLVQVILNSQNNNIVTLILDDNEIGDKGIEHIGKLKNIRAFSLGNNLVTDVGAKIIATKLVSLESLDISANQVSDNGLKDLLKMPNLKTLAIMGNEITEGSVNAILANQKLTSFIIDNNNLKPESIDKIKKHIANNEARLKHSPININPDNANVTITQMLDNQLRQLDLLLNLVSPEQQMLYQERVNQMFKSREQPSSRNSFFFQTPNTLK